MNQKLIIKFILSLFILVSKSFSNIPISGKEPDYIKFINKTKNKNDAFVAFQRIIERDIENYNLTIINKKLELYKNIFFEKFIDFDSTKFNQLYDILNNNDDQIQYKKRWLSKNINTQKDETNPIIFKNNNSYILYFISKDRIGGVGEEDIFHSTTRNIFNWKKPSNFYFNTNKPEAVTYASQSSVLFYSHRKSKKGGIYLTTFKENDWNNPTILPSPINDEYSFDSDAIFIKNENAIIFVSDRSSQLFEYRQKGDYFHGDYWGNTDIYISFRDGKSWNKPINLGTIINTPYGERTPWLSEDGMTLYFSSDGHIGLGRMDVFKSTRLNENSWTDWSEPENLGRHINTPNNDYGYKLLEDSTTFAIFSSKRKRSTNYDIAMIQLSKIYTPLELDYTYEGEVLDNDGNPVPDMPIVAENNKTGKKLAKDKTDEDGKYKFKLPKLPSLDDLSIYPDDSRFVPQTVPLSSLMPPSGNGDASGTNSSNPNNEQSPSKNNDGNSDQGNQSNKANPLPGFSKHGASSNNTNAKNDLNQNKEINSPSRNLSNDNQFLTNDNPSINNNFPNTNLSSSGISDSPGIITDLESGMDTFDKSKIIPLNPENNNYPNKGGLNTPLKNNMVDRIQAIPTIKVKPFNVYTPEESDCNQNQIGLTTVHFESKQWNLSNTAKNELKRLAEFLIIEEIFTIITGHTDSDSTEHYNQKLSSKRANEVKKYLVKMGCDKTTILTKGLGESSPIADESNAKNKRLNRRVEFCLTRDDSESLMQKN